MIDWLLLPLEGFDRLLALLLPAVVRIAFWGALSGVVAMLVYRALSNQKAIAALKKETRQLRKDALDLDADPAESFRALRRNLALSLLLLGRVTGPTLVGLLPLLLLVLMVSRQHTFALPEPGAAVAVHTVPAGVDLQARHPDETRTEDGNLTLSRPDWAQPLVLFVDGDLVYEDSPFAPAPVHALTRRGGWDWLFGSPAGRLMPDAPVEHVEFALPRKKIIPGLPAWASGWELVFFMCCGVASLATKFLLHIE